MLRAVGDSLHGLVSIIGKVVVIEKNRIGLSLDLVNAHYQEPNRNRFEMKYFWEELYILISAAGFSSIEIPYQPGWDFAGRSGVPFSKYAIETKYKTRGSYLAELRVRGIDRVCGLHLDPSPFMRSDNIDAYFNAFRHFGNEAIEHAAELGADYLALTPTPHYGLVHFHFGKSGNFEEWTRQFVSRTADLISSFAETAAKRNVVIALKTEYWSMLRAITAAGFVKNLISHSPIRIDIDTAHLKIANRNIVDEIRKNASEIGNVHLTDTAFVDDSDVWKSANPEFPHNRATQVFRDLGQGSIGFEEVCRALDEVDYSGWLICSCRQTRDPMRALLRMRNYLDNHILA